MRGSPGRQDEATMATFFVRHQAKSGQADRVVADQSKWQLGKCNPRARSTILLSLSAPGRLGIGGRCLPEVEEGSFYATSGSDIHTYTIVHDLLQKKV